MTNFKDCSVPSLCFAYFVAVFGHGHLCSDGSTLESVVVAVFPLPRLIRQPLCERSPLFRLVVNCHSGQSSGHITAGPWVKGNRHFTQFNIFFFFYLQNWYHIEASEGGDRCGGGRVWNDKLSIGFPYVPLSSGKNPCCYGNTLRTIKQARRINFLLWALCCHPQSLVLAWCLEPAMGEDPLQLGSGLWDLTALLNPCFSLGETRLPLPKHTGYFLWESLCRADSEGLRKCEMLYIAFISTYQNKWKHLI